MFGNPPPSPLDLNFKLLGTHVRIHPFFWVMTLLFGDWVFQLLGPAYLLIWVACIAFSILLHEFGHVWAFRRFGRVRAEIVLHGFGGLAIPQYAVSTPWKTFIICFAGPLMNLAIVLAVLGASKAIENPEVPPSPYLAATLNFLFRMNLIWFVLNLLPIYPLDGGQMFRAAAVMAGSRRPAVLTHFVSIGVCAVAVMWGLAELSGRPVWPLRDLCFNYYVPGLMSTIFFVLMGVENYQLLAFHRRARGGYYYEDDDTPPWRRR